MAATFSPTSIVMSTFKDNGQIYRLDGVIPSIEPLVRTYRGSIPEKHYLKDTTNIVWKYYDEVSSLVVSVNPVSMIKMSW